MKTSQTKRIRRHLMQGYTLTPLQALSLFGCMRLSARIYDLRAQGMLIKEERIAVGKDKYVSQYRAQK